MNEKKIAVLGASGFVGSRLIKRLKRNYSSVLACDLVQPDNHDECFLVDVESADSLAKLEGTECIINLAAVHRDDVRPLSRYYDVNVKGAKNICKTANLYNISTIIFTSSVAVYGFSPPNTDESGEPNYFNEYGRTKYLAEEVFKQWYEEDPSNRTLVIVRPTVIFGEGNRGNVYNLMNQISKGRFIMIGDGKNKKSMAYVENVAAFLEHSLSKETGLYIYNYIDKPDFDMNRLVTLARRVINGKKGVGIRLPYFIGILAGYFADLISFVSRKNFPISSIRVKKFTGTTQFATSIDKFDFTPPVSIKDGLERTLRYEFLEDNSDQRKFYTE